MYYSRISIMLGIREGKRPFGRSTRRWKDNIKIDLQQLGRGGSGKGYRQLADACEYGIEILDSIKYFWLGDELLAIQKGLCSMKLLYLYFVHGIHKKNSLTTKQGTKCRMKVTVPETFSNITLKFGAFEWWTYVIWRETICRCVVLLSIWKSRALCAEHDGRFEIFLTEWGTVHTIKSAVYCADQQTITYIP